jgi:hypothetical protein
VGGNGSARRKPTTFGRAIFRIFRPANIEKKKCRLSKSTKSIAVKIQTIIDRYHRYLPSEFDQLALHTGVSTLSVTTRAQRRRENDVYTSRSLPGFNLWRLVCLFRSKFLFSCFQLIPVLFSINRPFPLWVKFWSRYAWTKISSQLERASQN